MARTRHLIPGDYPEESNKWYLGRIQECSYLSISRRRIDITKDFPKSHGIHKTN